MKVYLVLHDRGGTPDRFVTWSADRENANRFAESMARSFVDVANAQGLFASGIEVRTLETPHLARFAVRLPDEPLFYVHVEDAAPLEAGGIRNSGRES